MCFTRTGGDLKTSVTIVDLLTLTPVLLCRKLCSKLDRLSDRNKRGGFYGGLVNQTDTRGKEREIEFRDSADEFVGTVRAARVAVNEPTPRLLFLVGGRKPS